MFISAFAPGAFEPLSQLSGELPFEFVVRARAGFGAMAGAVNRAMVTRRSASPNPSTAIVTFRIGMALMIARPALRLHQIFKLPQWLVRAGLKDPRAAVIGYGDPGCVWSV
jgi:hypothetical protein